jgi:RecB family exonuclease
LRFGQGTDAVLVGGRIDRVDVGQVDGQAVFTIVDYKTGKQHANATDDVACGRALQLAVYALAVARLEIAGPRAVPFQVGYWCVRQKGFVPGLKQGRRATQDPLEQAVWEALVKALEGIIPRLASAIRSGRFPVYNADPDCTSRCDYHTVCRVNQIRPLEARLEKRWAP